MGCPFLSKDLPLSDFVDGMLIPYRKICRLVTQRCMWAKLDLILQRTTEVSKKMSNLFLMQWDGARLSGTGQKESEASAGVP